MGARSSNGSQPVKETVIRLLGGLITSKTKPWWEPRVVIVVWTCAQLYEGAARGLCLSHITLNDPHILQQAFHVVATTWARSLLR